MLLFILKINLGGEKMKKVLLVLVMLVMGISMFAKVGKLNDFDLKKGEKKAILLVSFGTTYPETREKTIGALEKEFKASYPNFKVATAFTSRIIMRRIKKNEGITYDNPSEALKKLKKDGYTHILVQGTHIMNAVESETLKMEVENYKKDFKVLKVSTPLLTSVEDYKEVVEALKPTYKNLKKDEAVVFIGHGTHHSGNSAYAMLEHVFHQKGIENAFLGTVEGYPALDDVVANLKKAKIQTVELYPFMIVAGDHANNDIAVDMKEELEKNGFTVNVHLVGLGENKGIRKVFVEHAEFGLIHKEENMLAKKKEYANGMQL